MKVKLMVDGEEVPLNSFTQEIIGKVSVAMAESLRGVGPGKKEILIRVERD